MINKIRIATISLAIIFTSCQKVIDIDLNSKDPEVMIEGVITDDTTQPQTVKITKSVNFSQDNVFPAVSGANVTISDNAGNNVTLSETSPGVYQTTSLPGVSGRTYYLTVHTEGKTYTSFSTMPLKVNLDTIKIEAGFGPTGSKIVTPDFIDPVGKGNYYRFKLWQNKEISSGIFLSDDQISDGGQNNSALFDQDLEFETGDTATVTMMCIDKPVHLYFYSLNQNGNGPDASATPANPVTNIIGATLGYFSAQTTQTKKVIVP
ncbi:MAG TPA: DUF4249 domain-containing protein [Bacteroidia bacterium]